MNGSELAFAIGLEPQRAIEYLQSKGVQVSGGWRTVSEATHARAFTVANVTKADVLADIQAELVRAQKNGLTLQQFRDNLIPTLTKKGWFAERGQPVHVPDGTPPDPNTGELATQKRLTARRLQTIFGTNMQSSMMAGRYRELMSNTDKRPYWQYVAVMDGRTRPAHRAMHGRVLRYDDAAWGTIWPPNGWGCRCRVRALGAADVADRGLTVEASKGRLRTSTVPLPDGSTSTVTRYNPADGGAPFVVDPGFSGNPAQVQAADRLAVLRLPQVLPAGEAEAELRRLFTAPERLAEVRTFVATAKEARQPMGIRAGLGALDERAVQKLADEGVAFDQTGPVSVEDRLVAGLKAGRHAARGDALAPEDWAELPNTVAYGELLWDAKNKTLIYAAPALAPNGARNWVRVAVKPGLQLQDVRHAALVQRADLSGYERIRGAVAR